MFLYLLVRGDFYVLLDENVRRRRRHFGVFIPPPSNSSEPFFPVMGMPRESKSRVVHGIVVHVWNRLACLVTPGSGYCQSR